MMMSLIVLCVEKELDIEAFEQKDELEDDDEEPWFLS